MKRILWFRPDSIGDTVLASSIIPYILKVYNNVQEEIEIIVFCQEHIKELYINNPYVNKIITFNLKKLMIEKDTYKKELGKILNNLKIDIVINSVYSRSPLTEDILLQVKAKKKIGFNGNASCGMKGKIKSKNDKYYTKLIDTDEKKNELEKYKDFLIGLGMNKEEVDSINLSSGVIYTGREDLDSAEAFIEEHNINKDKLVCLFAGVQDPVRNYEHYGKAINENIDNSYSVIALGDASDEEFNQRNLNDIYIKNKFNLSGKTTILQAFALLCNCKLAVGAETGLAHIACIAGVPNVILLGGGHYGRFMPYSQYTHIVDNKLDCFNCDWFCKEEYPKCVRDVDYKNISKEISKVLPYVEKPVVASSIEIKGMAVDKESDFAYRLKKLIKENHFKNIIETGTYLGQGTTSVIASTLKEEKITNHKFYSIEVNPEYFNKAQKNLAQSQLGEYVYLLNGLSVPKNALPSEQEIEKTCIHEIPNNIIVDHKEKDRVRLYSQEINLQNFQGVNTPDNLLWLALCKMDHKPNIILLDSAGCMGYIEFKYLLSILKWPCYIVLDDTKHVKHYKSLEHIKSSSQFDQVYESDEKFGFCIARFLN